jgi:uncharacterized protein with NRDE domain
VLKAEQVWFDPDQWLAVFDLRKTVSQTSTWVAVNGLAVNGLANNRLAMNQLAINRLASNLLAT